MNKWNEVLNNCLELDHPLSKRESTGIAIFEITILGILLFALSCIGSPAV